MALLSTGCTRVSDTQRFDPTTEMVEITASVPEAGGEAFPQASPRLCWSDLLDPRSLTDVDAVIGSGSLLTDARVGLELRPWTGPGGEPLGADASEPWCSGSVVTVTPKEAMTAGVRYRVRLADAATGWSGEAPDLESAGWVPELDGAGANFFLEFDVVQGPQPRLPPDESAPAVTLTSLFESGGLFDPQRPTCSCHRDSDDDASTLLDLRTPASAYADLVFESRLRDTGYPMVTPRRPSESFLLHKVMRKDAAPLDGIYGEAMPPGDTALPYGDFVMLARWIEDGAQP